MGRAQYCALIPHYRLERTTIYRGKHEIEHPEAKERGRVRAPGAGRLPVEKNNPAWLRR